jgi:DNA (cytosine-5)-methyltransferase 1
VPTRPWASHREDSDTLVMGIPDPAYALAAGREGSGHVFGSGRDAQDTFVVAHSLRADGFDASEDGTGRGTPLVAAFQENQRAEVTLNDTVGALNSGGSKPGQGYPAVAFTASEQCLDATAPNDSRNIQCGVRLGSAVRRLTPTECERLQGYPDGWTAVEYRGRPAADGPRYRALGNAFAVPVMRWIARRIAREDGG